MRDTNRFGKRWVMKLCSTFFSVFLLIAGLTMSSQGTVVHAAAAAPEKNVTSLSAPSRPSAACPQPNRKQSIASLTLADRLKQGYPLPINGKTNPQVDQIIHDRGVHFCSDTDITNSQGISHPVEVSRGGTNAEYNDRIWSGNFADGSANYTYVQVEFQQSCVSWGTNDRVSMWAGIGGVNNNNLVQAGASALNNGLLTQYYAWIQNTASSSLETRLFNINCGDWMWVEIGTGNCMYVSDLTSGSSSGWRCSGPNANASTAECIVEAPSDANGNPYPLSNYGTETLHSCQVEINAGSNIGIGNVTHDYFNMYNGGTLLSSTGSISNGDTYTMTWHHYN